MKVVLLFLIVGLLNGCVTESKQFSAEANLPFIVEPANAARRLAGALSYETTWTQDAKINKSAFLQFHAYLEHAFPLVHQHLRREKINQLSLLYTWEGTNVNLKPVLFLGHQDVVPADNQEKWKHPPFAGHFDDRNVYGRGAIDSKLSLIGVLEATERLLASGMQPERTILLGFGHDEELMGTRGGEKIAQWLANKGIDLDFVLDEGPTILSNIVPGLTDDIAFVGTAARGNAYFKLSVDTIKGGHASFPPQQTPISILSAAMVKLTSHQFEPLLTQPLNDMMDFIGPEMSFKERFAYKYRKLFLPLILSRYGAIDTGRAITRTTVVPTMFRAGDKDATIPNLATAVVAMGIMPGSSIGQAKEKLESILDDNRVAVTIVHFPDNNRPHAYDPTPASTVKDESFNSIQKAIHQIFPEAIVSPTLMPGGTDGKYYLQAGVTEKVYYFFPIKLSRAEAESVHGINERIPVAGFVNAIKFYAQLILNVQEGN